MYLLLFFLWAFTNLQPASFGSPDFNDNNQLVMSINGDLWLGDYKGVPIKKIKWTKISAGIAEDRDPQWMGNSGKILFSSNREGDFDLWVLDINKKEAHPSLWWDSAKDDTDPSIAANGTVVWVNGVGPEAKLWVKEKDKDARILTIQKGWNHSPDINKEGTRVAYVFQQGRQHELRLINLQGRFQSLIKSGRPEFPTWTAEADRIVYSTRGQQSKIWITDTRATYQNVISQNRAKALKVNGEAYLCLVPLKAPPPYHNGDQDKNGQRYLESAIDELGTYSFLPIPGKPDQYLQVQPMNFPKDNRAMIDQLFEETVAHLTQKYETESPEKNALWLTKAEAFRSKIKETQDWQSAEALIYQLLKEKPFLRDEKEGPAAVSSAHPLASKAGVEILEKGGNVVDAAIAVSFAIGVVEPDASGLGGYGEMLIYLKEMDAPTCIEFLTRVPEAAGLDNAKLNPLPQGGPVMVNIPGTVAGMELAWKRYGSKKLKWEDLLAPAIRLAEEGFILDASFPTTLFKEQGQYLKYPSSKALFFKNGKALKPGDHFKNPDLAWTLKQIALGGAKAFYEGAIAKKMVKDLGSQGNMMTMEDMSRYYAVERTPVKSTYKKHTVYSGPPPVSGGANLVAQLNQLEAFEGQGLYTEEALVFHAMIEAWKYTPSGRGKIADPGLWPVDLRSFLDKNAALKRWNACFDPLKALMPGEACMDTRSSASWGAEKVLNAKSNTGTTAFVVGDAEGNMVSVTQTLGTWGGNFYVTPGLGFLYNDKLGSYGRNPKGYNARIPFARNVTSITPTIIFKGEGPEKRPYLAIGAAGNAWITAAVYEMIASIINQGISPQQAMEQARFLVGVQRDGRDPSKIRSIRIQAEDGFAPGVLEELKKKGHDIQLISRRGELRMGYAAALVLKDGKVIAGADPRRSGQAAVTN